MHKYADDIYIVIPACNIQSREVKLKHVANWALTNNHLLKFCMLIHIGPSDLKAI